MTYALVIVDGPILDAGNDEQTRWQGFLRITEDKTLPIKSIQRLGSGSWLFPLDSELRNFCTLIEAAYKNRFEPRVMFLEQKPSFNNS